MARREPDAVYVISVAAELSGMHPQTLRVYERKGLVAPRRTSGNTRRYSADDIERLQLIQHLTQEDGINLAGVAHIMALREKLAQSNRRIRELENEIDDLRSATKRVVSDLKRSYSRELVLYSPPAKLIQRD